MGADSRQTTVEAVVQTRKPTGAETYFAKSNTTELVKMTSTAGVEASSSLLLALLPLPPAAGRHTQEAAEPGGRRRRRLEESGVETKHNPITIYSLVGTLRHYGRVI